MSLTLVKKRIKVLTKHDKYVIIVIETSVNKDSSVTEQLNSQFSVIKLGIR